MSILLSRTKAHHCRWFVGEPTSVADQRVCGELPSWPTSYCREHRSLVYQPAPVMRSPGEMRIVCKVPEPDEQPELMEIFG